MESIRLALLSRQPASVMIPIATTLTRALITHNLPATAASVEYAAAATSRYVFVSLNSWCRVTRAANATRDQDGSCDRRHN